MLKTSAKDLVTSSLAGRRFDGLAARSYACDMTSASHPVAHQDAPQSRRVRLFRNGRSQAVRIPKEFELAGDEVTIRKEGDRLVIEPVGQTAARLRTLLATFQTIADDDVDIDDPPPPDVDPFA